MIKVICFDLDGVYFDTESFKRFKYELIRRGALPDRVDYYLHDDPMRRFKQGKIKEEEYWSQVSTHLGVLFDVSDVKEWLYNAYKRDDKVSVFVRELRKKGYKTCIVSNNFATRVEVLQEKYRFLDDFDVAVFSYELGVLKPDKQIYGELIRRLGVMPKCIALSDDNAVNVKSAGSLGMNAFLYKEFNEFQSILKRLGVTYR